MQTGNGGSPAHWDCWEDRTHHSSSRNATGACTINRPCAQKYVCKSQSCMVISGRLIVHAPVLLQLQAPRHTWAARALCQLTRSLLRVRFQIIRNARIDNVGKYQSCMVSNCRLYANRQYWQASQARYWQPLRHSSSLSHPSFCCTYGCVDI